MRAAQTLPCVSISQRTPRMVGDHPKLEKAGQDFTLPEGPWPGRHFEWGVLAFRTLREYILKAFSLCKLVRAPTKHSATNCVSKLLYSSLEKF